MEMAGGQHTCATRSGEGVPRSPSVSTHARTNIAHLDQARIQRDGKCLVLSISLCVSVFELFQV